SGRTGWAPGCRCPRGTAGVRSSRSRWGRCAPPGTPRPRARTMPRTQEVLVSTTVLLVDDHELIRQGLRRAFERAADFDVVGEAASVTDALRKLDALVPNVVVVDVRLPDGSGLDVVKEARRRRSDLGIVVLTMYAGDEQLFGALDSGASAFVPKDAPTDDVLAAARHAAASPQAFTARDLAEAMKRRMT